MPSGVVNVQKACLNGPNYLPTAKFLRSEAGDSALPKGGALVWDFQPLDPALSREWDEFLATHPHGHFKQTSSWCRFKSAQHWKTHLLTGRIHGKIVAGLALLQKRLPWGPKVGYITRGPICDADEPGILHDTLEQLDRAASTSRLAYLAVVPPYFGHPIAEALQKRGFQIKPDDMPPTRIMCATLLLDLEPSLDEILAKMRKVTRYDVRQGLKSGLRVTLGTREDLPIFHQRMMELCRRRGTTPRPEDPTYFTRLWDGMHAAGHVRLFVCRHGEDLVAGAFVFTFGHTARVWRVGWNGEHSRLRPNHLLWWEIVSWAKQAGFRQLDFVHIPNEHASQLLQGQPLTGPYTGVTEFKAGFGGQVLEMPLVLYRSYWSSIQLALRCGGRTWLHRHYRTKPALEKAGTATE